MHTLWFRSLILVLVLAASGTAGLHAETLVVYGDDNYLPVIHHGASGKPAGVLVDILRKVSARTGDTYDIQLYPWKRAYELARRGSGALVGVSLTAERSDIFDFSDPIYNDDIQIVVRKGREFKFDQISDLKGKTLGGVIGASYGDLVDSAIQDGLFKVDRDVGQTGRLRKLLAGRMDGAIIGNGTAGYEALLRSEPDLLAQRNRLGILKTPLARDPLYLAAPKSMQKKNVIERFNKALHELQKSGALPPLTPGAAAKK
jgi:polar amino acid transport system substrate-binding protein